MILGIITFFASMHILIETDVLNKKNYFLVEFLYGEILDGGELLPGEGEEDLLQRCLLYAAIHQIDYWRNCMILLKMEDGAKIFFRARFVSS